MGLEETEETLRLRMFYEQVSANGEAEHHGWLNAEMMQHLCNMMGEAITATELKDAEAELERDNSSWVRCIALRLADCLPA
jgi:hypothetical protein